MRYNRQPLGDFELNLFGDAELVERKCARGAVFSGGNVSQCHQQSPVRTVTGALHTPKSGIQAAIE